jgi:hypothetical protein
MPTITVHVTIPAIPLLNPTQARAILTQEVGQGMTRLVERIADEARQRTPVGVSGLLRASIGTKVTVGTDASSIVQGEVYTGAQAPYAEWVENGSSPHWPPSAPIKLWAARVLGDEKKWWLVSRAIARRGTRPRYYMRDAFASVEPTIEPTIRASVDRAGQRWQGGA